VNPSDYLVSEFVISEFRGGLAEKLVYDGIPMSFYQSPRRPLEFLAYRT
jgi:hypothetical protein